MAGTKALKTIAEAVSGTKTVVKAGKKVPLDQPKPGGFGPIDDLVEYQKVQSELDAARAAPATPQEVQLEIAKREAIQAESRRVKGITDPQSSPLDLHQSRTPEEFSERMNQQLTDPEFSARAILGIDDSDDLGFLRSAVDAGAASDPDINLVNIVDDVASSQSRHRKMSESILKPLEVNPRWKARATEWQGDSPYKGQVMFHTDKITDPTRPQSFLQFEDPKEFGLHAGTNAAAERVVGFSGIDDAMMQASEFSQAIQELAGFAGIPTKKVERVAGRTIEKFLLRKFRKQDVDVFEEWDELMEQVGRALDEEFGAEAAKLARIFVDTPAPNTTPFLFRGKNGLLLQDSGNFNPRTVAAQLEDIFPDNADEILAAAGGSRVEATQKLQGFIESKGYDHVVYHNAVEDRGNLSIINWNPDLQKGLWDAELVADKPQVSATAAASFIMGVLGIGAQDEEE